jgi:hypothetical protein
MINIKTQKHFKSIALYFFVLICVISSNVIAQETIRIMSYNVFEYKTSSSTPKKNALINVINPLDPDILIGVEIDNNPSAADHFRTEVLNSGGATDKYFLGPSPVTSAFGGYDNFAYYKPEKFTFLSGTIIVEGGKWPTLQFQLYNNLTGNKIIIYGVHLSSTSSIQRVFEADSIRLSSNALPTGTYFIAAGDFNLVSGTSNPYLHLLDQTEQGYFKDSGNFDDIFNTYNATLLDRRFDLILNSQSVVNAGGVEYVSSSFTVGGNDGSPPADQVYLDASDHLPVYADYTFGFPSSVNPPYPGSIVFTQVGASGSNDVIEFITLYRMDLTTLKITDNSVNADSSLSSGEGTYDLSNLDGIGDWNDVPSGTFVRLGTNFNNDNDASERILQYQGSTEPITPTLESGGEQLVAYTGLSSSPTYIAGINWGNAGWSSPTGTTSYPPGTPSDIELGSSNDYSFNSNVNDILYVTRNSLTSISNWGVQGSPGNYNDLRLNIGNGALPVELAFFTASLNGSEVELRWRTETEVNNYGFEIERSTNNTDWRFIGFVEGNGNSNSPKHYSFSDIDIVLSGEYYYRLKQIDNDGTYEYSDVVSVEVGVPSNIYLSQNYPNPFNPETRIDFTLPENQLVSLRVYNTLGELVKELVNEQREAGSYSEIFDASKLPSGVYIYRLQASELAENKKMTLIK